MTPKRLIYLMDGTWSKEDQRHPTNIAKLHRLIRKTDSQRVMYDPGVGVTWPRIAGGLFGAGIVENIIEGYEWIRARYIAGDDIILVGFSRGASQARELAGMLGAVGFDFPMDSGKEAWRRYRSMYRTLNPIPVRAVCVFDTVGARGVPTKSRWVFAPQFDDLNLGWHVERGFHAVAIDEQRTAYAPALWQNEAEHGGIEQLWFPGWHSDVGGGSRCTGLSDLALQWMGDRLENLGVEMAAGWRKQLKPDPAQEPCKPSWWSRLFALRRRTIPIGSHRYGIKQP